MPMRGPRLRQVKEWMREGLGPFSHYAAAIWD